MDSGEVERAFRDWTLANATDEQLLEMLRHLCSGAVPNDYIRHRELLRGITINHIQMARTIRDLKRSLHEMNRANEKTQCLVIVLAVIAIIAGAIQATAAVLSLAH